jgi:sugar (pentulose or hexulose) kinase
VVASRPRNLVLAIDVGTGSVRAALLDLRGRTVAFRAREHDQIVPSFGLAEQRPADWWAGAVASIRDVLDAVEGGAQRVVAVAACGQMHGIVLIDAAGELVLDSVQLWNDKRATAQVSAFSAANDVDALWPLTSAFGRLARLQAAMDRSPPARGARPRVDGAHAEGLHQFPADPPARHGRI